MSVLNVAHLGATSYRDGLRIQEALVGAIAGGRGSEGAGDWLLYPDHPSVLTVGRSPSEGSLLVSRDVLARQGIEVFEVARGGDITWHGPGQLVGYALCDLDRLGHDLHRFLRNLEQGLLDALAGWGVEGRRVEGRTGIWVGDDKLASIGVAVRRWVTYHGFALNVCPEPSGFELIHPCGLRGIRMATLAGILGSRAPSLEQARQVVSETVARRLGYAGAVWKPAKAAWDAAASPIEANESKAVEAGDRAAQRTNDRAAGGEARSPVA